MTISEGGIRVTDMIRLSDEMMEGVRASEAFRALDPNVAAELQEFLYTAFGGANSVSGAEAVLRLDRYLAERVLHDQLDDPTAIRQVILDALRTD